LHLFWCNDLYYLSTSFGQLNLELRIQIASSLSSILLQVAIPQRMVTTLR
jgi:hypothetical protein